MKRLLVIVFAMLMLVSMAYADEIALEPNTMVARINGEMYTFYLHYASKYDVTFAHYDENGEWDMEFHAYTHSPMKEGTYEGFQDKAITRCWLNTDYVSKMVGIEMDVDYVQYVGGMFSGTVIGGDGSNPSANNRGDIVLRIDKSTGYLYRGTFSARLHNVKKDTFIDIQAKFDYTVGEHYEPKATPRPDYGLSLDDIDF